MRLIFLPLVLLPFVAHAQTAAPDPAQAKAAIVLQQAQTAVKDAMAQPQAAAVQPAPQPVQAAPVVIVPEPTLADQVKDDLRTLASLVVMTMIGVGLTWMRSHMTIMQTAAMDNTATKTAYGLGALLVQSMQQRGGSVAALSAHSPEVSSLANSLIADLPLNFAAKLGLSQEKAGSAILKEAAKISVGNAQVASVSPVKAASDALVAEAPKWHLPTVS